MHAFIFAAGFGTRLGELTAHKPKALVPVAGIPMLERIIGALQFCGLQSLTLNTHYRAGAIEQFFETNNYPFPVSLVHEPNILGTGAGLCQAWPKHRGMPLEEPLIVWNCDIWCEFSGHKLLEAQKSAQSLSGCGATLLTSAQSSAASLLLKDSRNALIGFQNNGEQEVLRRAEGMVSAVGFCGIHCISPQLLIFMESLERVPFSIIEVYRLFLRAGGHIQLLDRGAAYWIDIGTPQDLRSAEMHFEQKTQHKAQNNSRRTGA